MKKLNEKQYYKLMQDMSVNTPYQKLVKQWETCFGYILRHMHVGYNQRLIDSLFWDFEMCNGIIFNHENIPYYANKTKQACLEEFCQECAYICDRADYDRLFRTHWLFRRVFLKEMFSSQH
jgi:hypothetical protein